MTEMILDYLIYYQSLKVEALIHHESNLLSRDEKRFSSMSLIRAWV